LERKLKATAFGALSKASKPNVVNEYRIASEEQFNGMACWKLSQLIDTKLLTTTASSLTDRRVDNVPREIETFVEKGSFRKVAGVLRYENGTVSSTKYSNIEQLDEVPDDFFLPPPDYEKVIPKSLPEYGLLLREIASSRRKTRSDSQALTNSKRSEVKSVKGMEYSSVKEAGVGIVQAGKYGTWFWVRVVVVAVFVVWGIHFHVRLRRRYKLIGNSLSRGSKL
jgi:hypothetical protein